MTHQAIIIDGNDYHPIALKDVKAGEFVVRKAGAKTVFTRGDYDRPSKTYALDDYNEHCRQVFLKGSTIVYIGFTY
jgi:hypothetical protein